MTILVTQLSYYTQGASALKQVKRTAFVKIISNYTRENEPRSWVKTKFSKMRCKKGWVAYLLKTHNVQKNQNTYCFNLCLCIILKDAHEYLSLIKIKSLEMFYL